MFSIGPVEWFDNGFGPFIIPLIPAKGPLAPSAKINRRDLGKIPGLLTQKGWVGFPSWQVSGGCKDRKMAHLWEHGWGSNLGFLLGEDRVVFDNDQGALFSECIMKAFEDVAGVSPPRRYVNHPRHERDAFFFRVGDFILGPANIRNHDIAFQNGVMKGKAQILSRGKQMAVYGEHPLGGQYVFDREIKSIEDLPMLDDKNFYDVIKKFVELVQATPNSTWSLAGPIPVSASSVSAITPSIDGGGGECRGSIHEVHKILELLPNIDKPDADKTPWDLWIDDYGNWVRFCYMIIGALGPTEEARQEWLAWNQRHQAKQTPESVWNSASQAVPREDMRDLMELAQQFAGAAYTQFLWAQAPDTDDDDEPPPGGAGRPLWERMRARYAFCAPRNGFVDMYTGDIISLRSFDFIYKKKANDLYREKYQCLPPSKKKKKPLTVSAFFIDQPDCILVAGSLYAPGDGRIVAGRVINDELIQYSNLWWPAKSYAPASAADVKPWLDHVEFTLGNVTERDRFLRWVAYMVQRPREKANWHWLVISVQGIGKDLMMRPINLAVGEDNWRDVSIIEFSENFTHFYCCKLLSLSETRQTSGRTLSAHDVGTRFKQILADPPSVLIVNEKNVHPYKIPNRLACVMFSNEENPLPLEPGQRRIHVINQLAVPPKSHDYYEKLQAWMSAGGIEQVAGYLQHYPLPLDIDKEMKGTAPASDAKTDLEQLNLNPLHVAIDELIDEARQGVGEFSTLLASTDEIAKHVSPYRPAPQLVSRYLRTLESKRRGVRRIKSDPKHPNFVGIVKGRYEGVRLWALNDTARDGTPWSQYTDTQILDLYRGKSARKSGHVIQFPRHDEEELV
jgi:hypothetical protein